MLAQPKKWGCWCWVTNRLGWLLELLTELTNNQRIQSNKAEYCTTFTWMSVWPSATELVWFFNFYQWFGERPHKSYISEFILPRLTKPTTLTILTDHPILRPTPQSPSTMITLTDLTTLTTPTTLTTLTCWPPSPPHCTLTTWPTWLLWSLRPPDNRMKIFCSEYESVNSKRFSWKVWIFKPPPSLL